MSALPPDSVAIVFLGLRPNFFRTTDAFRARRYEGPHRFTQKRPRSFVWALRSIAVVEPAKNQLLRDFRRRSIFDFCNTIGQKRKHPPPCSTSAVVPKANGSQIADAATTPDN